VEKPLAITFAELDEVASAAATPAAGHLLVGFNRRFAPAAVALREALAAASGPKALTLTMNAGEVPPDHWTQDESEGGGRIVGEACHLVDLARALIGAPISGLQVQPARARDGRPVGDIALLTLAFADGSVASVQYLANGSKAFPKERVEAHAGGRSFVLDNWRKLTSYGVRAGWSAGLAGKPDKGHSAESHAWLNAVRTGVAPVPLVEVLEVSRWSIAAAELVRVGGGVWE
jgi:predicted dehydrogenase